MHQVKRIQFDKSFTLESGQKLNKPTVAYHTYGTLNKDKSNVIWVCHALTANSDVFDWWSGIFGENDLFNPHEHYIVCANILGSHYGTTGPLSINPDTELPYFHSFPNITIRDMVSLNIELANHLDIDNIELLIGGSVGGHQALEWAILEPQRINNLCLIATSAAITPWAAAFNSSQRMSIELDPTWHESNQDAGNAGMMIARSLALLSYRNYRTYNASQQQDSIDDIYQTKADSYQSYQGLKLSKRFNAFSYWYISKAMDSHNIGRERGSISKALESVRAKTLVISIEDDILFPYSDQKLLADAIPEAYHVSVESLYGHDGFLLETKSISQALSSFLNMRSPQSSSSKRTQAAS